MLDHLVCYLVNKMAICVIRHEYQLRLEMRVAVAWEYCQTQGPNGSGHIHFCNFRDIMIFCNSRLCSYSDDLPLPPVLGMLVLANLGQVMCLQREA